MLRLPSLFGLLKRREGSKVVGEGRARRSRNPHRFRIEPLEDRVLLTTTLFMDFGVGVGMGNTLNTTAAAYRDIFGANTGTNLTDNTPVNVPAANSLDMTPLNYDFDGNGTTNNADLTALANAVVPLAQRALEPFDINIAVGNAANLAAAGTAVAANAGDATGQFDAYVYMMAVTSNTFTTGNTSVGNQLGLFGEAAVLDLNAQAGNTRDEAALTFADEVFRLSVGVAGTAAFNADLAQRLAYTATHEAFHTFTFTHTPDEGPPGPVATADQRLLASGDVIRLGSVTRGNPFIVTRYTLGHQPAVAQPNNDLLAANDADIGLRDANNNGRPDLGYVTGTGANDLITLGNGGAGIVNVAVSPFNNQARTTAIGAGENYTINLGTQTDGTLLVDASINADEVRVDATINATIRARGGVGADSSVSATADQDLLTLQGNGLNGTYTPDGTGAGSVVYAGGATINFSEFENLEATGVAIAVNPLTLSTNNLNEGDSLDLSGAFVNIDTQDTHQVVIAWGDGSANTTLNLAAGVRTFNASHIYRDDNPTGTAADANAISVTVTDQDGDSGNRGANVTVNNVDPVIQTFESDATFGNKGKEGVPLHITGSFTDVGVLDTHVGTVDWGDGTVEGATLVQGAGSGTISASHAYTVGGIFTITLTVTDDDTGTDQATTLAVITGVGLSNGTLYVIGSADNDSVHINAQGNGILKVHASFVPEPFREFDISAVNQIISYLCQGDDQLTIAGNVSIPAIIHGDAGNDDLHGGGGPTVLLGGAGDDMLTGQSGRDILIGGTGNDRLIGGSGDDVLIGGRTTIDHNQDAALTTALSLWTNPAASYAVRSAAISTFLTVLDDGASDKLTGAAGADLFYAGLADVLTDRKANELAV